MNRLLTIEMVPHYRGPELIYERGLGNAASVATINTAASAVGAATSLLPNKPVTVQSDFSKVANSVASVAGVVAAYTATLFPAGTVVAAVAGIVAAACVLLGKLFANSKSKAMAAERGQYETAIAQLQFENLELDKQYEQTYKAIADLRKTISSLGGFDGGLGLCLFKCKDEKKKLESTKAQYEVENKAFEDKSKALMQLVDEFNKLMREYTDLLQQSKTKDIALYVLIGAAVLGAGVVMYQTFKK